MLKIDIETTLIKELLSHRQQKILILSHRNPDGDAIGASLALFNILRKLGHTVDVIIPNSIPSFLQWMPGASHITIYSKAAEKAEKLMNEAEVIFSLDFNDINRIREFEDHITKSTAYKILIDHHPDPSNFSDLTISDTRFTSTCELLYLFIKAIDLCHFIDKEIASCLYAGIMTDTGCFSFNSSLPETFQHVAELLEYSLDKDMIFDRVYNNFSHDRMRLMGYCLDKKMQVLPKFCTAFISLSQEEMRLYNFRVGDSEGFVNLPLTIAGIKFSVLLIENKEVVRLSFRSKGSFRVNDFAAKHFKGGGHINAAGGETNESLEVTIKKFVDLLPLYKDELLAS